MRLRARLLLTFGLAASLSLPAIAGRFEAARLHNEKAWQIMNHYYRGDAREALPLIDELIAQHPERVEYQAAKAQSYFRAEAYEQALATIKLVLLRAAEVKDRGERFGHRLFQVLCLAKLHRGEETLAECTALHAEGTSYTPTERASLLWLRGAAYGDLERFEEAERDLEASLALNAKSAAVFATRGYLRGQQQKLPGALADLAKAQALSPHDPALVEMRARVLLRNRQPERALSTLVAAEKTFPKYTPLFHPASSC